MARTKRKGQAKDRATKLQKTEDTKAPSKAKGSAKNASKGAKEEKQNTEAKGIIIEACKQCNAFKTRAQKLQTLLEEGKPGISVTINPEKPRKGCFEVRNTETGDKYVSLLDMPRPFPPLKALDIDEVAANVLEKLS